MRKKVNKHEACLLTWAQSCMFQRYRTDLVQIAFRNILIYIQPFWPVFFFVCHPSDFTVSADAGIEPLISLTA